MKFNFAILLVAGAQAIQYVDYKYAPPKYTIKDMWANVKRGDVRDFATMNVEKAMKANPSSGEWPIEEAPPMFNSINQDNTAKRLAAKYQDWEDVVKKGNAAFSDVQVEKALKLIPEPIAIEGKVVNPGNPPAKTPDAMPAGPAEGA